MELNLLIEQLKQHLNRLKDRFEKVEPPENKKDKEFFHMVKTETSPVYELLEEWEEKSLDLVKGRKVDVHPHQVTSTRENMELLLLHSYYIDVRRKRYMELYKSIHYVFDQLLREL
ncbi:DUF1798 family protein [Virgibacillus xinjiangensis]|uniref:DUF1798 family protein n=1 Tax=Virgibacillus xinjiangensis TaxID=393090 RepID=A0ABV7CS09_9BACI